MMRLLPFVLFLFILGCSEPKIDSLIDEFGENEVENAIEGFREYSYSESHSSTIYMISPNYIDSIFTLQIKILKY